MESKKIIYLTPIIYVYFKICRYEKLSPSDADQPGEEWMSDKFFSFFLVERIRPLGVAKS